MPTPFTKAQGAGNDFILFDLTAEGTSPWPDDWSSLARTLCDRHFGIGADGLLLVEKASAADFRMRVINSDGSEPEMCGNGLRCVVRYLHDRGMIRGASVAIATGAGLKTAELIEGPSGLQIRLDMGLPFEQGREVLPLDDKRRLDVTLVSMGNPHCVTFVNDLERLPFAELGPAVEGHARFRNGVNVEFVQVLSRRHVRVKVWERGAGPTLACGTGACAVVVAAVGRGLTERQVAVELPGGTLTIDWQVGGSVFLTGPAELVFTGEIDLSTLVEAET